MTVERLVQHIDALCDEVAHLRADIEGQIHELHELLHEVAVLRELTAIRGAVLACG
jgi:hypothetical protein